MTPAQARLLAEVDRRSIETLDLCRRLRTELLGPDTTEDPVGLVPQIADDVD